MFKQAYEGSENRLNPKERYASCALFDVIESFDQNKDPIGRILISVIIAKYLSPVGSGFGGMCEISEVIPLKQQQFPAYGFLSFRRKAG
jgi:hypothetical protein